MPDDIPIQIPAHRRFIGMTAATIAAASVSRLAFADTNQAVTEIARPAGGDRTAVRPLRVHVPESQLAELRRRIEAAKWSERETVTDASQGVQLATMQKLARYWAADYNWRNVEARLNALPQFVTEIDEARHSFHRLRAGDCRPTADTFRTNCTPLPAGGQSSRIPG
nr:epoxide hydrolase N-terminal domain-containing protein [Paraburkholderia sp. LEh10]